MNKVILIGRLTKDPELKTTTSGVSVTSFTLAVNRPFTSASGEREADFINCVVWRKQAENVARYVNKGSQVAVEGRLQVRTYDDESGKRNWITEVVCDNVQFLDSKNASKSNFNDFSSNNEETNAVNNDKKEDPFASFGEEIDSIGSNSNEIDTDTLPF